MRRMTTALVLGAAGGAANGEGQLARWDSAAGILIEPPWSPPNEMSTSPAATATPDPADDAPLTWSWLCGLSGRP